MRKLVLFAIILMAICGTTKAQEFSSQVFIQQTVMGLQKGYGIRYQTSRGIGIGALFQSNGLKPTEEFEESNYPFYGIEAIIPVGKCNTTRFFLTPKVGFVNDLFLVLIPEVETEIRISNTFSAGITAGIRAKQSSAGAKIIAKF